MPAETIHGGGGVPVDIKVLWGAGCEYVQVAAVHENGTRTVIDMVNEWLVAAKMPTIDYYQLVKALVEGGDIHDRPEFRGWYATIDDRAGVNRMIAVLRRARDHAFGKDE